MFFAAKYSEDSGGRTLLVRADFGKGSDGRCRRTMIECVSVKDYEPAKTVAATSNIEIRSSLDRLCDTSKALGD